MRMFGMFIGLCLVAYTSAERVDVPSDGELIELIPQTGAGLVENRFDLYAPTGSKMVLSCAFETYSCHIAKIMIDTGEDFTQHCPKDSDYIFMNSYKNRMTVTIENTGNDVGAYCQVKATKPYIDIPETMIDSSEHGQTHKSAKAPSCRCGWTNKSPRRIVGGVEASVYEYPFPILLIFASSRHPFCGGGSIITPHHVLTAAHCTDPFIGRSQLAVVVGEHDIRTQKETAATRIHEVSKVYQHPGYTEFDNNDDISILELKTKIEFNDKVGPVCMPSIQKNMQNQFLKVMGWGLLKDESEEGTPSPTLHKVNLRVVDPEVCKVIYGIDTDTGKQICTYNNNKDSCQGDSGGPLVSLNNETNMLEQVAVVSYGRKCGSTDPAVNTDVAAYMPWIKKQLARSRYKVPLCF
uniref:Venom s1 protease 38 n=1 Tax=Pristhesancus plagipennis TaxID=1955184 RepID=A0A1Q1NPG9_PRIPG|nr:venom s1 protease 38 [Pristhesancus plagipennis]